MENFSLTCNNKKVWDFYQEHKNIDFESMNIIFVDIMLNLSQDMNSSLSNNIAAQLLNNVKSLQSQVNSVSDSLNKLQAETINTFGNKFNEFKKEYFEDVKMILSTNTSDKIAPLVKEYNSILLDKIFIMVNDVIPKNNENLNKQIQENIKVLHNSMNEDTNKLVNSTINKKSLDEFINILDNKISNTISNSQQMINTIVSSSEKRLDTTINQMKTSTEKHILDIKDISSSNQTTQVMLQNNVGELLKKMEVSSCKGKMSENVLFNILQSLYSTAQIDIVGDQKETGDIMLTRKNKPTILIENKNWSRNVIQDEVKKFIRDVEIQGCCGLFLSQNYGIANKENFEININDGNVLLYVHEVRNDAEKIRIAIDMIDNFKYKLDEIIINNGNSYTIDKEVLDEINKEYQYFVSQKLLQIKTVKDFGQKMIKQIEENDFPSLEKFLSTRYAFSSSKYVCEFCDFVGKNQSAMSAHKRGCKSKLNIVTMDDTPPVIAQPIIVSTEKDLSAKKIIKK